MFLLHIFYYYCRNGFIHGVVNVNRLYKIISIFSIFLVAHLHFIFNVIYYLNIDIII